MPARRDPGAWIAGEHDLASIGDAIAGLVQARPQQRTWRVALAVTAVGVLALILAIAGVFWFYVGIWGVNIPVAWGLAITNFVWWVGIAHAGTLISAILLLAEQPWRRAINRFAEAMTLFAIACAAMFPLLHLGRPEFFYWLIPYPSSYGTWPQFQSPLVWDFFAIMTYGLVSLVFWYIGLIPDLAVIRDRSTGLRARIYGVFALGWRGSARHWHCHQTAYLLLAGLATTLVVSVHTIVSFDFAVAQLPGWHSTVFPPYFVAGAIFSGFAMVLAWLIPVRAWLGLHDFVTDAHLDRCAKLMLASGLVVAYGYAAELFFGWYSGDPHERSLVASHLHGRSAALFWTVIGLNVVAPQALWWRGARRRSPVLFVLAVMVLLGMWLERYLIVIGSLEHGFLPTTRGAYTPTRWDWLTLAGTVGLFSCFMLLFIRFVPIAAIAELRELADHREEVL